MVYLKTEKICSFFLCFFRHCSRHLLPCWQVYVWHIRGRSLFISWEGGGLGNFLVNPSFLRRPPCQLFISQSTPPPQQKTVCNADPSPHGPSPLLSQEIITLEIPNDFQNIIKHEINKKDETMTIKKGKKKKKIDILFSKTVNR